MKKQKRSQSRPGVLSRRGFLGGCAALGSTSLLSSMLQLKLINTAYADGLPTVKLQNQNDYKALVCIFLYGGVDSHNILVPNEADEYAHYANIRRDLALEKESLLPINGPDGRAFGLHPGMPEVQSLYNQQKLAFVSNIGTLVRPTSLSEYNNGIALPNGLFSHNDQQQVWQTSTPQSLDQQLGWIGRMADMINNVNVPNSVSMNISLNTVNMIQSGNVISPYVISDRGAQRLTGYQGASGFNQLFTRATDSALAPAYDNLIKQAYSNSRRSAIDTAVEFDSAIGAVPAITTPFPKTALGKQLKMIAQTIAARGGLGANRQTFFAQMGGFDHHDDQPRKLRQQLPQVSQALAAFHQATVELGISDQVVAFTASDFGRTLTTNGGGSDHAWAGNHMVMGGPVQGGRIYGHYPTNLSDARDAQGNPIDTGRGRIIPTTSIDELYAELAMWFGMSNNSALEDVLPNIRQFYSNGNQDLPIGFLQV